MPRARAAVVVPAVALAACIAAPAGAKRDSARHSLRGPVTDESFQGDPAVHMSKP